MGRNYTARAAKKRGEMLPLLRAEQIAMYTGTFVVFEVLFILISRKPSFATNRTGLDAAKCFGIAFFTAVVSASITFAFARSCSSV